MIDRQVVIRVALTGTDRTDVTNGLCKEPFVASVLFASSTCGAKLLLTMSQQPPWSADHTTAKGHIHFAKEFVGFGSEAVPRFVRRTSVNVPP